jgi:hypothetical protein
VKKRLIIFLIFLLTASFMLKFNENKALDFSPSKGWGMFFNTRGDIKINITEPGVAVKIEIPREFLEGRKENDTSFLYSNITRDYYYYSVIDQSLHYPYDKNAPYTIEILNPPIYLQPGCVKKFLNFTPPRCILMNNLKAPSIAGLYNFSIYIAKNVDDNGLPIYSIKPSNIVTVPVSMREDPSSIYGYIIDEATGARIKAKGVVFAIEVNTGVMARAYVDASTGFFNLTGLYEGTYRIEASAGYFPETGYAYALTEVTTITIGRGQKVPVTITENAILKRGSIISGKIVYLDTLNPSVEIPPLESPYLKALGFKSLNYTIEVYDEQKRIVASNVYSSKNLPHEPFRLIVRNGTKYAGYPPIGTEYAGFGPGKYALKAWVFGFIQLEIPSITVSNYGIEYSNNRVQLVYGGLINGTIRFLNAQTNSLEIPRKAEQITFGTAKGTYYGGNILIKAYNENGELKGLTIINATYPNGTFIYSDETMIKFYILGFSEFYNKTYSGVWEIGSYPGPSPWDSGLPEGQYEVKVWIRGYIQANKALVSLSKGGESTVTVDMVRGGAFQVTLVSMHSRPGTRFPQAETPWRFLNLCPQPYLRVYFYRLGLEEGFAETQLKLGFPGVTETRAKLNFSGQNPSIKEMIYDGTIPSALREGEYLIKGYTYGYVQSEDVIAYLYLSQIQFAAVILLIGVGVNGTVTLIANDVFSELTENTFIEVDALLNQELKGVDVINASKGLSSFAFSIYGFYGRGHFFYVSPDGVKWKDYGLDVGNYSIHIPEFGFDWRYKQKAYVSVNIQDLGITVGVHFPLYRLGKIYGLIQGETFYNNFIPLIWASIIADDRVAYSFDGDYVIHVPEGEYNVEYSYPGYEDKIIHALMGGSFAISQDVILKQAFPKPPFPTASLAISIEANYPDYSYVFSAKILDSEVMEDKAIFLWSSDSGRFNSTIGKTVLWSPLEDKDEYEVKVVAVINGEAFSSAKIKLETVKTSEFPKTPLVLTLILILTIIAASKRREEKNRL